MSNRADSAGIAFVVAAGIGFGLLGPLARYAADAGFTPTSFAIWRSIASVATLTLLLWAGVAIGRLPTIGMSAIPRPEWLQLMAMGVFVAGTTLSIFWAYERTTIALALIVFYTFPVMVAVAAVPVYGEHLGARKAAAIGMAVMGLVLLLAPGSDGGGRGFDVLGVLFAFTAALCQVGYALVGARGFASVPALQSATILRAFSLLLYGLVVVPLVVLMGEGHSLSEPLASTGSWVLVLLAGAIAAALPTALLVAGYRRIGPTRGAVLMLTEPLTGVILAALLLAERPTVAQLVGGVLVLAGAALVQVAPTSRTPVEPQPTTG